MGLRKDQQSIQSKRSLLKSGGNQGSVTEKQSPMVMKTTGVMSGKAEDAKEIKLPKLDPTKTSIAMHSNSHSKPQ